MDLFRVAARVAATMAYRVVTDEPVGVAIGFEPAGFGYDKFVLKSDDGGENVYIDSGEITISKDSNLGEQYPEPDLLIWRSPEEFEEWKSEMDSGETNINFKSFKYDIGDERSFGRLEFEAETPRGVLKYEANIDTSGEMEDEKASLDGKSIEFSLGIELPHLYGVEPGMWTTEEVEPEEELSEEEAKQAVIEGLNYWMEYE